MGAEYIKLEEIYYQLYSIFNDSSAFKVRRRRKFVHVFSLMKFFVWGERQESFASEPKYPWSILSKLNRNDFMWRLPVWGVIRWIYHRLIGSMAATHYLVIVRSLGEEDAHFQLRHETLPQKPVVKTQ